MNTKQTITINYPMADGNTINISVSIEVAEVISGSENKAKALRKQDQRHLSKSPFNEDEFESQEEGVMNQILAHETKAQVHNAMEKLTETQRRRVYLHFFCNMSYRQISKIEGVDHKVIIESVNQALAKLKKYFDK